MRILTLLLAALIAAIQPGLAAPTVPDFWDARERLPKPDLTSLTRLRFLTTTDFPPFNFLDSHGRLSGFNVDLARAICQELDLGARCQIEAMPWGELENALRDGGGEAIIAGVAISEENREKYSFSRSYLQFPARFITRKKMPFDDPLEASLAGKRVGIMSRTAHETMLHDLFPDLRAVAYTKTKWMLGDLQSGKLDAVFGDGMRLALWLNGADAKDCCTFAGGPYLAPEYLGEGMAIATPRGKENLTRALDYALQEIGTNGKFAELYLRYFPVSFF